MKEATIQCKLVQAIFRFPDYTLEQIQAICKDLSTASALVSGHRSAPATYPQKNENPADKPTTKQADSQPLNASAPDKEGIKMDKGPGAENAAKEATDTGYIPKKNVVLRSGVRWIEKGIVFDPKTRQNRRLYRTEWEELLKKGLTKADFQGWHPDC